MRRPIQFVLPLDATTALQYEMANLAETMDELSEKVELLSQYMDVMLLHLPDEPKRIVRQ